MKKVLTVDEVLAEISAKKKVAKDGTEKWAYNRFNKRNYEALLRAMLNDPELKAVTVKLKEFLRKILVKAGIDAADSNAILSKDFVIDNVSGLYEFFATSMYLYMNAGNRFDLIPTEDFRGSIFLEDVPESTKVADAKNPNICQNNL